MWVPALPTYKQTNTRGKKIRVRVLQMKGSERSIERYSQRRRHTFVNQSSPVTEFPWVDSNRQYPYCVFDVSSRSNTNTIVNEWQERCMTNKWKEKCTVDCRVTDVVVGGRVPDTNDSECDSSSWTRHIHTIIGVRMKNQSTTNNWIRSCHNTNINSNGTKCDQNGRKSGRERILRKNVPLRATRSTSFSWLIAPLFAFQLPCTIPNVCCSLTFEYNIKTRNKILICYEIAFMACCSVLRTTMTTRTRSNVMTTGWSCISHWEITELKIRK